MLTLRVSSGTYEAVVVIEFSLGLHKWLLFRQATRLKLTRWSVLEIDSVEVCELLDVNFPHVRSTRPLKVSNESQEQHGVIEMIARACV